MSVGYLRQIQQKPEDLCGRMGKFHLQRRICNVILLRFGIKYFNKSEQGYTECGERLSRSHQQRDSRICVARVK